jgi:hypothetical protein
MIPENILGLGVREAELRAEALAAIQAEPMLGDHLDAIEASMTAIMDHVRERPERNMGELVTMRLGIRLFNDLASGLSQALAGYYHQAFDAVRDVVELQFLFDDFADEPDKVIRWATAERVAREKEFKPIKVRERLDARYEHTGEKRRAAYQALSTMASHASPEGFSLFAPADNLSVIGPFFEKRFLGALLGEMAQHGLAATVNFTSLLPAGTDEERHAKHVFAQCGGRWLERYMGAAVAESFVEGQ